MATSASAYDMDDVSTIKDGSLSVTGTHMSTLTHDESAASGGARLLSQATSTATIAAKSILSSGGSEATALKTAKAAAQSVLKARYAGELGNGPMSMMRKRKIKRQAEVVSSMALVSALNSLQSGSEGYDVLSQTNNDDEHKAQLQQLQYAIKSNPSLLTVNTRATQSNQRNKNKNTANGDGNNKRNNHPLSPARSLLSGISGLTGFSNMRPRSPWNANGSSTEGGTGEMEDILEEEEPLSELQLNTLANSQNSGAAGGAVGGVAGVTSDDEQIVRPVAIRIESAQPKASALKSPKSTRSRDIALDAPDEDPIYDTASRTENGGNGHYATISETSSSGVDDDDDDDDDDTRRTDRTGNTRQSFIATHVEPYLFGFACGSAACGGPPNINPDDEDGVIGGNGRRRNRNGEETDDVVIAREMRKNKNGVIGVKLDPVESDVSSVRSDELLGSLSRDLGRSSEDELEDSEANRLNRRRRFSLRNKVASIIRRPSSRQNNRDLPSFEDEVSEDDVSDDEEDGSEYRDGDSEGDEDDDDLSDSDDSGLSDESDDSGLSDESDNYDARDDVRGNSPAKGRRNGRYRPNQTKSKARRVPAENNNETSSAVRTPATASTLSTVNSTSGRSKRRQAWSKFKKLGRKSKTANAELE